MKTWRFGDKPFPADSDRTCAAISVGQEEVHVAFAVDNTTLCSLKEVTAVRQIHPAAVKRSDGCDNSGGFKHGENTVRW